MNARRRTGSIYVLVMVSMSIILIAGLSGLELARATRQHQTTIGQVGSAREATLAGLDFAIATATNTNRWRTDTLAVSGAVLSNATLAGAKVTVTASAPAGSTLTDGLTVPVILASKATIGTTAQTYRTQLTPVLKPVPSLSYAITGAGNIVFSDAVVRSTGTFLANSNITMADSHIWADLIAHSNITGSTAFRTTTPSAATVAIPNSSIISTYRSRAVTIEIGDLPSSGGFVLGPGYNPYGEDSEDGIYEIDLEGGNKSLSNFRVVGTLILSNVGNSAITGAFSLEPGPAGNPVLLVDGKFDIKGSSSTLSEATAGRNFNPAAVPYQGASDSDQADTYPSRISGITYVNGKLDISGTNAFEGTLICTGDISVSGSLIANHVAVTAPPKGFIASSTFAPTTAAYQRIVE